MCWLPKHTPITSHLFYHSETPNQTPLTHISDSSNKLANCRTSQEQIRSNKFDAGRISFSDKYIGAADCGSR